MKFLPVSLNISGKKILIVGGGSVALQKINGLMRFTKNIIVVAPVICDAIKRRALLYREKPYSRKALRGVSIVYACTNDKKLNAAVSSAARKKGIMTNAADDPENCDFISPAIYKKGRMSVAVSSDGKNVKKSIAWRDKIKDALKYGGGK